MPVAKFVETMQIRLWFVLGSLEGELVSPKQKLPIMPMCGIEEDKKKALDASIANKSTLSLQTLRSSIYSMHQPFCHGSDFCRII